jgi:hypothetical protein
MQECKTAILSAGTPCCVNIFRRVHKISQSDLARHVRPSVRKELGSYWTDFDEM